MGKKKDAASRVLVQICLIRRHLQQEMAHLLTQVDQMPHPFLHLFKCGPGRWCVEQCDQWPVYFYLFIFLF